ncbi:Uncharacterized protein TCM_017169 [Theobroma cacao]|uniref:Uncharacterized protein n=1 Tax=Theobroma cacao TaxID=3641 RepID=A0A061EKG6_THECC|nr:Uncharacterized protein TCM_017169 [Theobroma cacao]
MLKGRIPACRGQRIPTWLVLSLKSNLFHENILSQLSGSIPILHRKPDMHSITFSKGNHKSHIRKIVMISKKSRKSHIKCILE